MDEHNKNQLRHIAQKTVDALIERGVFCYIYHEATTGSVYIRFENPVIGSVRLADHDGRAHLKYKFNLLLGNVKKGWRKENNKWRYFADLSDWKDLVDVIVKSADYVKENDITTDRTYFIPGFKKSKKS